MPIPLGEETTDQNSSATEGDQIEVSPFKSYNSLYIEFVKAQRAYEDLEQFQRQRDELVANVANIDPDVYASRLKELDDKIRPLRESFFGKSETFAWAGGFELNPDETGKDQDDRANLARKTLFVYSKSDGICYDGTFHKT